MVQYFLNRSRLKWAVTDCRMKSNSPSSSQVFPLSPLTTPLIKTFLRAEQTIFRLGFLHYRFIAKPCALHVGIQDSGPYEAQPNAILEKVFISITKVSGQKNRRFI